MWWELMWVFTALILLVVVPLLALYLRRRWLTGQGGVFDCAVQLMSREPGVGWSLGMGRYRGEEVQWFRAFSLSLRPKLRFLRGQTHYVRQRIPQGIETVMLYEGSYIVTIRDVRNGSEHKLAMGGDAAMALTSWLEAAPPGVTYPSFGEPPEGF